jgi:dolichyl-phosphate beta-glucosyltransferase
LHLSVVIPCYNEESRITSSSALLKVERFLLGKEYEAEIVAVDDGSEDGTLRLLEDFRGKTKVPFRIVSYHPNKGKAHAVREGVLCAGGDFILFTDVDLSAPIEEVDGFLPILERGEADVVIGSRNLPESRVTRPMGREVLSRGFNLLVRALILPGIRDSQCGFKCFRRSAAHAIFAKEPTSGLAFDVEILHSARRLGYRIVEKPVEWEYSRGSKMHPMRDSARMFAALVRLRVRSLLDKGDN